MAASRTIIRETELNQEIKRDCLGSLFAEGDSQAHVFKVSVLTDGKAQALSGYSVFGYFMRPNETTVIITGSVSGNTVTITLQAACYVYPGNFQLIIRVVSGSTRTAVYWGTGYMVKSTNEEIVDPGTVVPDLTDLLAKIDACDQATQDAITATTDLQTKVNTLIGSYSSLLQEQNGQIALNRLRAILATEDMAPGEVVETEIFDEKQSRETTTSKIEEFSTGMERIWAGNKRMDSVVTKPTGLIVEQRFASMTYVADGSDPKAVITATASLSIKTTYDPSTGTFETVESIPGEYSKSR